MSITIVKSFVSNIYNFVINKNHSNIECDFDTKLRIENARSIYSEQIRIIFQQMPISIMVNMLILALTVIFLYSFTEQPSLLFCWATLLSLLTFLRGAFCWQYQHVQRQLAEARRWSWVAIGGSALSGILWGFGAVVLCPPTMPGQMFLTFVIAGMCAGSIVTSAAHLPVLFAYLLPAGLPLAVRFFIEGGSLYTSMACMIVIYMTALSLAGLNSHRLFSETLRLRFQLAKKTHELDEAARQLETEIAEHHATEATLRQIQKMEAIGHLTGGISHDFNNLLTAIIGSLDLALNRLSQDMHIEPLLKGAFQAASRGATLTQRLMAFARKQHLEARSVDLYALVNGIENLLLRTLGPTIQLTVSSEDDLALVHADANQLELAILNLVINARDAMPTGGTLSVRLENRKYESGHNWPADLSPTDYDAVVITDTGTGIDEATLARVFEPFFTTKEVGAGSGLGLSMVHGFAAQSGGMVQIHSKPGKGTRVEIWLPSATAPLPEIPCTRLAPTAAVSLPVAANILICEDDPDVRNFLRECLITKGYIIHEANNPATALHTLEKAAKIDLLITDYAMPEMNGMQLIYQARKDLPSLKALLITGQAEPLYGALDDIPLLRKPFRPDDLQQRLNEILT